MYSYINNDGLNYFITYIKSINQNFQENLSIIKNDILILSAKYFFVCYKYCSETYYGKRHSLRCETVIIVYQCY